MTEMLEKAIEIEGLIRILRDGTPSPEIYDLIHRKAEALAQWASSQTKGQENKRTREQEDKRTIEPEDKRTIEQRPEEHKQLIPESAIREEIEDDVRLEEAEKEERKAASDDDIMLSLDEDDNTQSSTAETNTNEITETNKITDSNKKHATQPSEQRCLTNIKAYFSLNDRFLYARELFDGSMKTFDSTLKFLEGVSDYATVEDYFYNELDWDRDNEHVKSFMEILKSKF